MREGEREKERERGKDANYLAQSPPPPPLPSFLPSSLFLPPPAHVPPGSGAHHAVAEEGRVRLRPQEADDHHRSVFSGEEEESDIYFPAYEWIGSAGPPFMHVQVFSPNWM